MKRPLLFALMFMSAIAAAKPPVPVPAVQFSNYGSSFVIESFDGQAMQVNFKGKLAITGVLFFNLAQRRVIDAHLVPDAAYLGRIPQVVGGFKPIPLKSIELTPADAIFRSVFGPDELANVSQGGLRVVSKPVRVVLRNFSTFVECDWRYYTATVDPADVTPLTLTAGLAATPAGGC